MILINRMMNYLNWIRIFLFIRYIFVIYPLIMHLSPQFMWSYFEDKVIPYNLSDSSKLVLPKAKSSSQGINSLRFGESLLWNNVSVSVKNCQSLNEFKIELKNLGNINCTYLMCRWNIFWWLFSNFINLTIYDISM